MREDTFQITCQARRAHILLKWVKLMAGLVILALMVLFFSSGYSPPGIAGEVLRHNQRLRIDASPLFYDEVENMSDLENGLAQLMRERKIRDTGAR